VPDDVSNRLIIQSHELARLPVKLKSPEGLCPGTNDHEELAMHENKVVIEYIAGSTYVQEVN